MKYRSLLIRVIILLFISTQIHSQPLFRTANLSTKDGLPSNVVKSIVQDNQGYMWFATQKGLSKYDGYNLESIILNDTGQLPDVTTLFVASNDVLWIGTKNKGLFFNYLGKITHIPLKQRSITKDIKITSIIQGQNGDIWIGSNLGLFNIDTNTNNPSIVDGFINQNVVSISPTYNQNIIVATVDAVYLYDNIVKQEISIQSEPSNKNRILYTDQDNITWLGRDRGLFIYSDGCSCFKLFDDRLKSTKIHAIVSNNNNLWIGTLYDGLYMYSHQSKKLNHYQYNEKSNNNGLLADTNIISLHIDNNETLWIGTFRGGLNYFNLSSLYFGLTNYDDNLMYCADSLVTFDLFEQNNVLWIATEKGLVKLNHKSQTCKLYQIDIGSGLNNSIRSILVDSKGTFWIGTSKSLYQFNPLTGHFKETSSQAINSSISFIIEYKTDRLLLGSVKGLYAYDTIENSIIKIDTIDETNQNIRFNNFTKNNLGQYVFATHLGIFQLTSDLKLKPLINYPNTQIGQLTTTVYGDEFGGIWFGADYKYLLYLHQDGHVENFTNKIFSKDVEVQAILPHYKELWISSNMGVFRFNTTSQKSTLYDINDGLQDNEFLFTSNYLSPSGKLYFGGKNGFNAFFADQIPKKIKAPNTVISHIQLNGHKLQVGDKTNAGYLLNKSVNDIAELVLNHKDNKIDIEFSALDYSDSKQNKYAYRLMPFNDKWEHTSAANRHATYTNLHAGDYTFELKSANKYGLWSKSTKQISLKVLPAPWLSFWAFAIYIFIAMFCLWCLIRYKTISARKKAKQLEATIISRTNDVNVQKKMVESLLQHKNEVFANVTHEFKTPLTLIVGPLEQLAEEIDQLKHIEIIQMVQRNTQRLMLMVSQILKLSEAELNKKSVRESQAIQPILAMLYEAFNPIADSKGIKLLINNNVSVNINATPECFEIVIGNLLSNALKFTSIGGEISISSQLSDNNISVSIKDTGTGMKRDDLDKIFNRFARLDMHKNTQGTGIGLSVVKEITEANDGHVTVSSEWGAGSMFKVTFPVTNAVPHIGLSDLMVNQMAQNIEAELMSEHIKIDTQLKHTQNSITILIIEDNIDMQTHIGNVLSHRFNCLFANRGKKGIALALKDVPDIIICDVMMPGLDGYKVTRILRHDSRTSHIPIVLLTALNTKESRIKGWRENIDIYVTKPFDAKELNAQLDNILIIRKILQQQTNKVIKSNGSLNTLDLPQQDLKFIEKFKDVIAKNYANNHFQKADLASNMAVSERQLQRKVTALIDESPLNMLRNYRLEKAAISLKNGYQVSIVSDECGFNSVPYFCRCFRENYGVSPKKYQLLHKT